MADTTFRTVLPLLKALDIGGGEYAMVYGKSRTIETPFTGAGNMVVGTHKIAPAQAFILEEIELHLSAAPTTGVQNLVITKDDGVGIAYDLVILTIDLKANAVTDLVIKPEKPCKSTDVITAAWTNTDARTFGLIFKHRLA